ncbi:hypothetical protein [Xanthomonas populi]|nr:hypothetical protein [Xanthomonas populi]
MHAKTYVSTKSVLPARASRDITAAVRNASLFADSRGAWHPMSQRLRGAA